MRPRPVSDVPEDFHRRRGDEADCLPVRVTKFVLEYEVVSILIERVFRTEQTVLLAAVRVLGQRDFGTLAGVNRVRSAATNETVWDRLVPARRSRRVRLAQPRRRVLGSTTEDGLRLAVPQHVEERRVVHVVTNVVRERAKSILVVRPIRHLIGEREKA
jgi:hypothetical protein